MWAPTSALCTARIQLGPAQPEWETQALDFKALSESARFAVGVKEETNEQRGQKMGVKRGGCCGGAGGSKRADEESSATWQPGAYGRQCVWLLVPAESYLLQLLHRNIAIELLLFQSPTSSHHFTSPREHEVRIAKSMQYGRWQGRA